MINKSFVALALTIVIVFMHIPAHAARGPVKIINGTVTAENGTLLRSVHYHFWRLDQYRSEAQGLKDCHFNSIRVMAFFNNWCNNPNYNYQSLDGVGPLLDQWVAEAKKQDMYIIIDNHHDCCGSYDQVDNEKFWGIVAPRFKDEPHVIYEIQNEPVWFPPADDRLMKFEQDMYEFIRARAPNNHIICFSYANGTGGMLSDMQKATRIDWSNASMAWHIYGGPDESEVARIRQAGYTQFITEMGDCDGSGNSCGGWGTLGGKIEKAERLGLSWSALCQYFNNRYDGWRPEYPCGDKWPQDPFYLGQDVVEAPTFTPPSGTFDENVTVSISSATDGAAIYYTIDGSIPTSGSTPYDGPFILTQTTVVNAKAFKEPLLESPLGSATYRSVHPREPDNVASPQSGVTYALYKDSWSSLPDFASLTPDETGTVASFDLSPAGTLEKNYAILYSGYIKIPSDGEYTFYAGSDDGSAVYVGSMLVVGNDGVHGPRERSGPASLKAGMQPLSVAFFQGQGGAELTVSIEGPGMEKQEIPASMLFHSGQGGVAVSQRNSIPLFAPSLKLNGRTLDIAMPASAILDIHDMKGMLVRRQNVRRGISRIDLGTLPNGTYLARLAMREKVMSVRLIVAGK